MIPPGPLRLVIFDLDGTIVRGNTCVQALADHLGKRGECDSFEQLDHADRSGVTVARELMAGWLRSSDMTSLLTSLDSLILAPGAAVAFRTLRSHGITTAIASMTWEFAVERFARLLGADYFVGTRLSDTDEIGHVWPEDKATWAKGLAQRLRLSMAQVAAVGDSPGDYDLLASVGYPLFVGAFPPPGAIHLPEADLLDLARLIVEAGNGAAKPDFQGDLR